MYASASLAAFSASRFNRSAFLLAASAAFARSAFIRAAAASRCTFASLSALSASALAFATASAALWLALFSFGGAVYEYDELLGAEAAVYE